MFTIYSMQILYRQSTFMESIVSHQTKVKLVINNNRTYQSKEAPVKERLSVWNSSAFPTIELEGRANSYNLEFIFYKNSQEVGRARCLATVGRNKKDCLDVANRNFNIIGKFLYEIVWRSGQPQQIYNYSPNLFIKETIQAASYDNQMYPSLNSAFLKPSGNRNNQYLQQQQAQNQYVPPNLQQPYFKNNYYQNRNQSLIQSKNQSKTSNSDRNKEGKKREKGMLQGMFGGCFGCGMAKGKKKKTFFAIQPIVMESNQLPYAAADNPESFSIQYYSKRFGEKYKI